MSTTTTDQPPTPRAIPIVLGALAAVIAAIVVITLLVGGGDAGAPDENVAATVRIPTSGAVQQVSFAEGAGAPLVRFAAGAADPAVGVQAPMITASYFDDTETTIDMADGTPRIVMFFAHWCPHCQVEVAELSARFSEQGLPDDVEIIAVSTSVDEGSPNYPASDWFLNEKWPVPVLRDSAANDLAFAYGLSGFPFAVAVSGDGAVVGRVSGQVPEAQFNALIQLAQS